MPAPSMQPVNFFAGANPDLYQRQLALQQQQALAQQLMEQGSEIPSPNQPTNPGGFVPRLSPLTAMTGAGKMMAGAMMQRNINKQQGDLAGQQMQAMIQMLRGGATAPPPAAVPGTLGPLASPGISDAGANAAGAPWLAQSQQPMPTNMSAPSPQAPQTPHGGLDMSQLIRIYAASQLAGPAGGQFAAESMKPTDLTKNIEAASAAPPGSPAAAAYAQHLHPPVVPRGFPIQTIDPATGQYRADPSSMSSILDFERQKLNVTEPYKITGIQQPGGGQRPVFNYQLPGYPGAAPSGAQPAAATNLAPPAETPAPRSAVPRPGDPWASMPLRKEPSAGIGESTYSRETAIRAAEAAHKLAEKYGSVAQTANERKSFNTTALQQLPMATTGPGALEITGLQNFLTERFGVPADLLKRASAGDPAATQEVNKNLLNAATKTAKAQYGSRMTQSEVMLQIKQGSASTEMNRRAIEFLLKADNDRADYEMKQAGDLGNYLSRGGDPYQFEGWYTRAFPLSAAVSGGSGRGGGLNLSPATKAFLEKNRIQVPQ